MTGGPERRDESVTFSLKELMKLEDERVDQEKQAREQRELSAKTAREEAARRERVELEAKERAAAEERERARLRELEEEARRDAIQRATIEQARITVEARTRAEESERERRHELELQRMRAETVKKPGPGGFIGCGLGGAAFALAVCLVLHFAVSKPASDKRVAELDRAYAGADGRAGELDRRVEEQKSQLGELKESLAAAKAEIERLKAPPQPPRVKPPVVPTTSKGGGPAVKTNINDGPPCDPHDPLCGHIDRAK